MKKNRKAFYTKQNNGNLRCAAEYAACNIETNPRKVINLCVTVADIFFKNCVRL